MNLSMSLPLDDGGFLRRTCERCGKDFKIIPETVTAETFSCPYCGTGLTFQGSFTKEQERFARETAANAVAEELSRTLGGAFRNTPSRGTGISISISVQSTPPSPPRPISEPPDNMIVVTPSCHPDAPLKIAAGPYRCHICGNGPYTVG